MAYRSSDLSVLAYANGYTKWHYRSEKDNLSDVLKSDYWIGQSLDMLRNGDSIEINAADGFAFVQVNFGKKPFSLTQVMNSDLVNFSINPKVDDSSLEIDLLNPTEIAFEFVLGKQRYRVKCRDIEITRITS